MEFEKKVVDLDVNDVLPNRFQPRIKFNEDSINELCESIKEHGVIQPIVVRAMGDKYEIIAGERRYKASLLAGKQTIPAVITDLNDKDSAEVALIENVQRKDLTPIEEAISYKKILDMGYLTQEELAIKLGKNQSTVANKLRLLNLDEEVQEAVLEEKISERHARSLLKLSNMIDQRQILDQIIENRLTVRKTDEIINQLLNNKNNQDDSESNSEKVLEPMYFEEKKVADNPFKVAPLNSENVPTFDSTNIIKSDSFLEEPIIIIDDSEQMPIINEDQVTVNSTEDFIPLSLDDISSKQSTIIKTDNIPSNPIEEAPVQTIENEEAQDKMSEILETNPGFMNIENIENNAKDINILDEKEPVDINNLLKPSVNGQEIPVTTETLEPLPEEELKVGKFFTLPVDEENEEIIESENKSTPSEVSTNVVESFDYDLNNEKETIDFTTEIPNKTENLSLEKELTTETPILQTEVENLNTNNKVDDVLSIKPISPVIEENLSLEQPFDSNENLIDEDSIPSIATEDLTNNLINPDFDFNLSAPIEREVLTSPQPISSEDMPVPSSYEPPIINKNIAKALELIRENTKQLEKMGYIVDTDEFDFETAYQVIIKIEK